MIIPVLPITQYIYLVSCDEGDFYSTLSEIQHNSCQSNRDIWSNYTFVKAIQLPPLPEVVLAPVVVTCHNSGDMPCIAGSDGDHSDCIPF